MLLDDNIFREYLTYYESKWYSKRTLEQFYYDTQQFIKYCHEHKKNNIEDIIQKDIFEFTVFLRKIPLKKNSIHYWKSEFLCWRTIARKLNAVKRFFYFLNRIHEVGLQYEKVEIPRYATPKVDYVNEKTYKALIECIQNDNKEDKETKIRNELFVKLTYTTGMRLSETLSVKRKDVLADVKLDIMGKWEQRRPVYITSEIQDLTRKYLQYRTDKIPISKFTGKPRKLQGSGEYLFIRHDDAGFGNRISKSRICEIFKEYSNMLWTHVHCHALRHWLGTLMMKKGVSIRVIQKCLWHKHITTTERYTHVENDYLQKEHERVFAGL